MDDLTNLTSKRTIKTLLKRYNTNPSKQLGQNFLINKSVLKRIIEAADLSPKDTVLEIGPGIGTLTHKIAKKVKKVIVIEKDKKMVEILQETLKDFKNVKIIQGDILTHRIQDLIPNIQYKMVANLPFYLTSSVIRKFLEFPKAKLQKIVLIVQKEVAKRICAHCTKMNLLAVCVQFYGKPKIVSSVSKKCFWPSPKVDGAIIQITPLINTYKRLNNTDVFFKVVKAGFSQPRKQLVNNLSNMLKLDKGKTKAWLFKNTIEPSQRAETLDIQDWIDLTRTLTYVTIK